MKARWAVERVLGNSCSPSSASTASRIDFKIAEKCTRSDSETAGIAAPFADVPPLALPFPAPFFGGMLRQLCTRVPVQVS